MQSNRQKLITKGGVKTIFKYVWIIILVLISVLGWIYSICDIVRTIRDKEEDDNIFDILSDLEEFTLFWVILYTIAVFIVSSFFMRLQK